MVLAGFVTAWRLASWPTSRSPVFVNATTLGTVRPPSADAMTVGSPPSMTATTEFVVPRSIPMILAMVCVCSSSGRFGSSVWSFVLVGEFRVGRARVTSGDGHKGRPQDAIAESIPAADLFDDLALGPTGAGHVGDSVMLAWVERHPGLRRDRAHALAFEQGTKLAVDGGHALEPRLLGDRLGPGVDGAIEVVGDREHLADEVLPGKTEVALTLLRGPALEVEEFCPFALEGDQVL